MTTKPEHFTEIYQRGNSLTPIVRQQFQNLMYAYYHANPRPMPWRETTDPYRILVSEIMLQQTQVERVKIKYAEFMNVFPTVFELAAASLSDVLRVWQGLGYNRRAVFLKRCSEEIVTCYGGHFPCSIAELQSLPGIGPYTARAVAAFAFGIAAPLIETNVRTVYIHFFFHGRAAVSDDEIMPLVEATLDQENPREWYYALMDYGVMLKQTLPNPGRRSKHHTQQSRFEGSNRQLRGRILRAIVKQPYISVKELLEALPVERETLLSNLEAMQREGFLVKRELRYCIAGEYKRG
jgi:A/G-specific adenine glycosylase